MKSQNFMEMKPKRHKKIEWKCSEGKIALKVTRNSKLDKFMNKIFNTPRTITIDLDEIGSFVWERCDGSKNIYEIGEELKANFGERANPPLERLVT